MKKTMKSTIKKKTIKKRKNEERDSGRGEGTKRRR